MSANDQSGRPLLDWQEWDFGPVRLADDELAACHTHEYGRELAKRCSYILTQLKIIWRANELPKRYQPTGDLSGAWVDSPKRFPEIHPDLRRANIAGDKLHSFGIPTGTLGRKDSQNQSWYSLPEEVRNGAVRRSREKQKYSKDTDWMCLSIHTIRELQPSGRTTMKFFQWGDEILRGISNSLRGGNGGNVEYGFFSIDWNSGVGVLKKQFAEWLDRQHKEQNKRRPVPRNKPSRGRLRDQLHWLGALRIKEHYGRRNLVEQNIPDLIVPAPYASLPDLYTAASKALKIIDERIRRITQPDSGRR
jgi:hypothetical protein